MQLLNYIIDIHCNGGIVYSTAQRRRHGATIWGWGTRIIEADSFHAMLSDIKIKGCVSVAPASSRMRKKC